MSKKRDEIMTARDLQTGNMQLEGISDQLETWKWALVTKGASKM